MRECTKSVTGEFKKEAHLSWSPVHLLPNKVTIVAVQFAKLCLTLCNLMDCSARLPCPSPSPRVCPNSCPLSVMPSHHLILCCPLLLLPSIFPSIRVFSNELALCIKWPEYWNISFSISPSNEYSGLNSFRVDWFDLLAVRGTLKSLLQHQDCEDVGESKTTKQEYPSGHV